jgi:exopolysaccharide biosynthesis WecB/TagA/CpsF family protein
VSWETPTVDILGVPFARLDPEAALAHVERLYDDDAPAVIAHANVHTVNLAVEDPSYRDVLRRANLVLNDGKGVMLAARLFGARFPADLNGNFFGPLVLRHAASRGWPTFFFGSRPGVARRVAQRLTEGMPGLDVVGVRDGFVHRDEESEVADEIRSSGAGLVFVALGNPRQELWLDGHIRSTGARLGIGVGAFFDFQAGEVRRAPAWMNHLGLEWVHRLGLEPRRMWRRYLLGNPLFIARVLRERFSAHAPQLSVRS